MAADQIFILVLLLACFGGIGFLAVHSRRQSSSTNASKGDTEPPGSPPVISAKPDSRKNRQ